MEPTETLGENNSCLNYCVRWCRNNGREYSTFQM